MAIATYTQTELDNQLGVVIGASDDIPVCLGYSSTAPATNTLYFYSSKDAIKADFGTGPLVEQACLMIGAGTKVVGVMKITTAGSGSASSVTASGGATGTVATTGSAPVDDKSVKVQLTKAGAVGTAEFQVSLDGGLSYSEVLVTAASYAIPSGLNAGVSPGITLAFSGTFTATESHTFTTTAPKWSNSELATAVDALLADARDYNWLRVVGVPSSAANGATFAATIESKLETARTNGRYLAAILEAADDTDANLISAYASFTSTRVAVCAGFCDVLSETTFRYEKRHAAYPLSARVASIPIHEDAAWVGRGKLANVKKTYRDEFVTPGLDNKGFSTLRTWPRRSGVYAGAVKPMHPTGSDFNQFQFRRVMNACCALTLSIGQTYSSQDFSVNNNGTIAEGDAASIENRLTSALTTAFLPTNISNAVVKVDRTIDMLATQKLEYEVTIVPKAYAKAIVEKIGFGKLVAS